MRPAIDVGIYDENKGKEDMEVDFTPSMPVKVAPGETLNIGFDMRLNPQIKANETYFAHISARLRSANRARS